MQGKNRQPAAQAGSGRGQGLAPSIDLTHLPCCAPFFPPHQIDRCFGFDTAVEEAQRSLISARVEARSSGGISVVKLMGRQSGFIAMNASMASGGCPGWGWGWGWGRRAGARFCLKGLAGQAGHGGAVRARAGRDWCSAVPGSGPPFPPPHRVSLAGTRPTPEERRPARPSRAKRSARSTDSPHTSAAAPPAPPPAGVVDACLIPEIRFDLEKLCDFVASIMARKDYCVVCVAEGGRCRAPG